MQRTSLVLVLLSLYVHIIGFSLFTYADSRSAPLYLNDEDVQLHVNQPKSEPFRSLFDREGSDGDERSAPRIAIDLFIYNHDDNFFITLHSADGYLLCSGTFQRSLTDRVRCNFHPDHVHPGDNTVTITISMQVYIYPLHYVYTPAVY